MAIWDLTPHDAPLEQMYGVQSDKDKKFWNELEDIQTQYPHGTLHTLTHWPVYTKRILMTRFLAHFELFKMTVDLPGSIVELGVSRGVSFFTFHKFLEIFAPTDTSKKVYGFDSFEGLSDFNSKDGVAVNDLQADKKSGGWSAESVEGEIFALTRLFNEDNILARERSRLIKGRVQDTLGPFLEATPGLRINLLHFDLDLYEPTLYTLEKLWDLVVPGGVVVFDEYGLPPWGGEATAFDEFVKSRNIKVTLRKFPWCLTPTAYCIKE
ncbi:TylF/MycF/NovP-related O-methyltransferase [Pseudomonas putida]|uniref:TylF/MycF/NovP-related O-methyltransferase n=1 Tax=Pseudomonas putida TaxID=303 RepID=UPI002366D828|nr:TylF/MycF/NovP-related O-methyltransferase [Pseudomonas putida]MDD2048844.1 TylF/MycF family methyltransferase [Pseudomonas putida]